MIILILIASFLMTGAMYAVERPDDSVVIVNCFKEKDQCMAETLPALGLDNPTIKEIDKDELPPRSDRDFWELKSGKVKVNQSKKDAHEAEKAAKKAKIDNLKQRLGLSDEDLAIIREGI